MERQYLTAKDVADICGVSIGTSYKIIRGLNDELKKGGYITVTGKIPIAFFKKKYFGFELVGEKYEK